ncbi:tail protein [Bacillus phage BCPST]|uniref:Tail component-like protein n=1 Tax=Bacillus phage BCPST TaxID=2801506 RepID=A0AAE7P4T0_9CAUD|nr:tail protein [Bacillus phage BCPST]QQO38688.1 tail component-like protein [Bacillus phage BCPST]QSJ04280.1 tail component-like protein [Bacillus phage BCP6]
MVKMGNIVASGQITLVDLNDAKVLQLYVNSNQPKIQIYNPNGSGSYVPDWSQAATNVVLTPQMFIAGSNQDIITDASVKIKWYDAAAPTVELVTNANYEIPTTGLKTLKIKSNLLSSKNQISFICKVTWYDPDVQAEIEAIATIDFAKVTAGQNGSNGQNAITAVLTNDTHTVPTDANGAGGVFTTATTTMMVYNGATDDSQNWTYTAAASTGVTGSFGTGTSKNVYSVSNMTVDSGTVDITAKKAGQPDIVKRFTIIKNKQGITGSSATSYWLVTAAPAIQKNTSGAYVPASFTVNGKSQTGTAAPVDYKGRFKVYDSTDGTTFTTVKYSSSIDESSASFTPTAGIKAVKIEFYSAGQAALLDSQIIPVVSDGTNGTNGTNGQNSVVAYVWTPEGNVVKNGGGTVKAQCDVYNGTTQVTSGVTYQWYRYKAGLADQGAGIGWEKLTSTVNYGCTNYTTATMTIPASAVESMTSFICIATYSSKTYKDVATIIDQSDPIQLVIFSPEGTVFKNGQGEKNPVAKVFQGGVEIDVSGTIYDYKWSLRKANGTVDATFAMTGKTIKVTPDKVDNIGNLICDLWTKN